LKGPNSFYLNPNPSWPRPIHFLASDKGVNANINYRKHADMEWTNLQKLYFCILYTNRIYFSKNEFYIFENELNE